MKTFYWRNNIIFFKTPLGSKNDVGRGCLATLSVLVVRISLLEYSKIHENQVYSFFVSLEAFKMYYVMRASAPYIESLPTILYRII